MYYNKKKLQTLYRQIEKLEESFKILGDNFLKQAQNMKEPGIPPGIDCIKNLKSIRRKFNLVSKKMFLIAKELSLDEGFNKKPNSLSELKEKWYFLYNNLFLSSLENIEEEKAVGKRTAAGKTTRQKKMVEQKTPSAKAVSGSSGMNMPVRSKPEVQEIKAELICDLIKAAKPGPAFWLASYCEQNFNRAPVPSWLIKSIEIAAAIQGEGGPAAEWLAYLYKSNDFEALPLDDLKASDPATKTGFNLMVFSATLKPALLAPASGALSLLGKLQDLPKGLRALDLAIRNYQFPTKNENDLKKEVDILTEEAKSWYKQNRKLNLASPAASKLWKVMQEEGGLIYKILNPIQENNSEALEQIRELCALTKDKDNLKNEIIKLFRALQGEMDTSHIPGLWQIINRSKRAIKLGKRWIKLQEKINKVNAHDKSLAVEFREPLQLARAELQEIAAQYKGNPLVEAGLAVTRRALDSLEKLPLRETRESLSREDIAALEVSNNPQLLLKIPWKPKETTVENMSKALLGLLGEQFPALDGAATGECDSFSTIDKQKENSAAVPLEVDKIFKKDILTPQEREFIKNTLKTYIQ